MPWEQGRLVHIIRDMACPYVRQLMSNPALQDQLLDAYGSSYLTVDQAEAFLAETRMSHSATTEISALRAAHPVPDIPVVVLSASAGLSPEYRAVWTQAHADLVKRASAGTHIVVDGVGHAIHQERPAEVIAAISSVLERCGTD